MVLAQVNGYIVTDVIFDIQHIYTFEITCVARLIKQVKLYLKTRNQAFTKHCLKTINLVPIEFDTFQGLEGESDLLRSFKLLPRDTRP